MKIAIFDIDNTITFETEFMKKYAPVFLRKNGFKAELINESGYSLHEIYGLKEEFIKRGMSVQESSAKAEGMTNKFWNQYFLKYNRTKVRQGVTDVIRVLRKYGYEIHFVSLRGRKTSAKETCINKFIRTCIVPNITKWMLKRNKIHYDKLTLVQTQEEKLEYIKYYSPDIVFEDQSSVLNAIDKKIKKVCVLSSHNKNKTLSEETTSISDYKENIRDIEAIINKVTINKDNKDLRTMLIDSLQLIIKNIGK